MSFYKLQLYNVRPCIIIYIVFNFFAKNNLIITKLWAKIFITNWYNENYGIALWLKLSLRSILGVNF